MQFVKFAFPIFLRQIFGVTYYVGLKDHFPFPLQQIVLFMLPELFTSNLLESKKIFKYLF